MQIHCDRMSITLEWIHVFLWSNIYLYSNLKTAFFKEKNWQFHGLLLFFLDFAYESDCMKPLQNHCILII